MASGVGQDAAASELSPLGGALEPVSFVLRMWVRTVAGRLAAAGELAAVRVALGRYHPTEVELSSG